MANLTGKGLTKEVLVNKFNISELHEATLEQDLDYIFHVECDLPMEWYTKLEETKKHIVNMLILHSDAAFRRKTRELVADIATSLNDSVVKTVFDHMGETTEMVSVQEKTNLNDLMGGEQL